MGFIWSAPRPEVEVATGHLRGKTEVTPEGTKYHAFLGIPYAKPPVGELRFKAPEPAEPWAGVRDATVEGSPCFQGVMDFSLPGGVSFKLIYGAMKNLPTLLHRAVAKRQSEDCLVLNVFAPISAFPDEAKVGEDVPALRPVVFVIHGGAFKYCDGNPDFMSPDLFIDKNVVVVTMNYRLGVFGFLALGTTDVPGNAGLKDQALALRWTRDNIRAFGGDPEAITVYGESAGGASAHHVSLSPMCRGMFRAVIASSGSACTHWAYTENNLASARGLAKELGLQAHTPEELAKALRSVSAARLNAAANKMVPVEYCMVDELMFLPVLEPAHPGAFQSEDPLTLVRDGKSPPVPLMTGLCSAEGLVWTLFPGVNNEGTFKRINEHPYYFLPPDLRKALDKEQRDACVREILDEYTGGKPFSRENVVAFLELYGDVMFMARHVVLVKLHAAAGSSPVYQYRFNFVGKLNCLKWLTKAKLGKNVPRIPGASHGDDLWYVSNPRLFPLPTLEPTSREMLCRRRMVEMWVNFIEKGDPTPPGTDEKLIPVRWTPCSASSQPYMDVDDVLEVRTGKIFPRQAFWEELYKRHVGRPMAA